MTVHLPQSRSQTQALETLVDHILDQAQEELAQGDLAHWREDLRRRLEQLHQHPEQGLGFIEEHVRQATLELQRLLVQKAMQEKANTVDEHCPDCGSPLRHKTRRVGRWVDAYCGKVRLLRTHGWCPRCEQWVFPADRVLGLRDDSTASPLVQEMCALLVSKMPAEQAEAIALRVTGRALSRSSLAREAQRQGDYAIAVRERLVQAPVHLAPTSSQAAARREQSPPPFTLVLQIDAWNIRERDHWGQTQAMRRRNPEFTRWHWVYTATCFRLHQRCRKGRSKNKLRAVITERSYVATRGGLEPLMKQLYYEARARGLGQAQQVLVLADGAVWIWNLVEDRFKDAVQRLDLYHANAYLWAVANELHGAGTPEARRWVKPLLRQIRNDQVAKVITQLAELKPHLTGAAAIKVADDALEYYGNNKQRMKYKAARKHNEPVGSGAIESTCRQLQCRMKRCGQFWSTSGDEALLCLEMFWRNQRWELLFPHAQLTAVSNN